MRLFAAALPLSIAAASNSFLENIGTQNVFWTPCPPLGRGVELLQCANLQVPLDYDDPTKGNITLGISRYPARDRNKRIGNLFYNPGGPGERVTNDLAVGILSGSFIPEILDSFDLIGVDLRGTGRSSPINCSSELYRHVLELANQYPTDKESYNLARNTNKKFRQSCKELSNNTLVDYMDTISIAKDHEYTRRAIGNESITFFGQSYGTQLAVQYAELFPDCLRAVLLDASNDLAQYNAALLAETASSLEAALKFFFTWCEHQNATVCPLSHTNQTIEQTWTALISKFTVRGGHSAATSARALTAGLLERAGHFWPLLAQQIYEAVFLNNFTLWEEPLPKSSVYNASGDYAFFATSCSDRFKESCTAETKLMGAVVASQAPLMEGAGPILRTIIGCIGWPAPSRNPPHKINIPRTNNNKSLKFMMVTTLYDPATSTWFTQTLHQQIGEDRAAIVMRNFGGHTTYFKAEASNGPTVASMNKFLLTLEMPPSGTVFEN